MPTTVTGADLRRLIDDDLELAVLDLRSPLERTTGHLARSAGIPLHELEQRIRVLVPRLDTPIVLASGRSLDEQGARILEQLGYTVVGILEAGLDSWTEAGGRVYTGTNVRSKTLGEWIEHTFGTATIDSATVDGWRAEGRDVVVLDSRPHAEYVHHHIPGGLDTGGGAELAYRGLPAVPGPDTTIVVNCAGRTRGIVGAQSLINTGITNPVYSLHNGTPAWTWAGLELDKGVDTTGAGGWSGHGVEGDGELLAAPTEVSDGLRKWAQQTLESAGVELVDGPRLGELVGDAAHTTYVIDVRTPEEHAAGHVPGSRHVQGGQLVQGTDEALAVHHARVVLVDTEDLVRSASTVQWLRYLHDGPVLVHVHDGSAATVPVATVDLPAVPLATSGDLAGAGAVLDLRSSSSYAAGHLPGSVHARREHLPALVPTLTGPVVLVGDTHYRPHFAAADVQGLGDVRVLDGGIEAWDGERTTADPQHAGDVVDQTGPPPFGPERDAWYREYFEWEYSLVPSSEGDDDFAFERFLDQAPEPAR